MLAPSQKHKTRKMFSVCVFRVTLSVFILTWSCDLETSHTDI